MFIRLNLKAVGRKMKGALFYFYGYHGDVIMEFFGLDELVQAQVDAFDDFVGGKMGTFLQGRFQARLIKQVTAGIHGFGDAVGVE
jgi:hypothetical protein